MVEMLLVGAGVGAKAAATIGTVASTAFTIGSTFLGMSQARSQAETQAKIAEANATQSEISAGVKAARLRRRQRLQQSKSRAIFAESGSLSGSAFDVLEQEQVADELDALTVKYRGDVQGAAGRADADNFRTAGGYRAAGALVRGAAGLVRADPLNFGVSPNYAGSTGKAAL